MCQVLVWRTDCIWVSCFAVISSRLKAPAPMVLAWYIQGLSRHLYFVMHACRTNAEKQNLFLAIRVVPFASMKDEYHNYAVRQRVTIHIDGWQWRQATGSFAAIICKMIRQEMAGLWNKWDRPCARLSKLQKILFFWFRRSVLFTDQCTSLYNQQ